MRLKSFPALVLVLGLLAAGACGVKTAPYPEAATLPAKVQSLTQTLSEQGELTLTWRPPENNMAGRPLKSLAGFQIEMAEYPDDDAYCLGCPHQYVKVDRVSALEPPPGMELAPGPYRWRYRTTPGRVYHFRVAGVSANGGLHPSAWSETVVWALASPGALPSFSAAMGDRSVELRWRRPAEGYRVEIQKRGDQGAWQSLAGLDQSSGKFSDLGVAYEKTYVYRARQVRVKDGSRVPGPWSREASVKVIDVTPPNPPGYLDAALSSGGVRLTWESLAFDPDLAGYRVYRQLSGESEFRRIGPSLLKQNAFTDPVELGPDRSARYRVTSVDQSPRANESRPSPVAEVLLEPMLEAEPRPQ